MNIGKPCSAYCGARLFRWIVNSHLHVMKTSVLYLISALVFAFFLGFIDEGYYNLKTFESIGNIIVLLGYAMLFWVAQLAVDWMLKNIPKLDPSARKAIAVVVGLLLPIIIIMTLA